MSLGRRKSLKLGEMIPGLHLGKMVPCERRPFRTTNLVLGWIFAKNNVRFYVQTDINQ